MNKAMRFVTETYVEKKIRLVKVLTYNHPNGWLFLRFEINLKSKKNCKKTQNPCVTHKKTVLNTEYRKILWL